MIEQFTWIPIYQELASELAKWQDRQGELIAFLEDLRSDGLVITPFNDKDNDGGRFLLKEMDPFTFFGVFNRGIRYDQRMAILTRMKQFFELNTALAEDFNGLPILNNQKSWFIAYQAFRSPDDVAKLWRIFQLALMENPLENSEFLNAF